jgi:hypothetical protein
VLITSAAIAVTLSVWHKPIRWAFLLTALVFTYTTLVNIFERPEGLKIACVFIFAMVVLSVISRALRSTELRITGIRLTPEALELLGDDDDQVMRIVALRPKAEQPANLDMLDGLVRFYHSLAEDECLCFFEVERGDASDVEKDILVTGVRVGRHRILRAKSPVVANAFAALLIALEKRTGKIPHAYFKWHEGNPIANLFAFLVFGEGDAAPLTHEVLRRAVPDAAHRPVIHVS